MTAAEKELLNEKFKGLHAFIISSNDLQAERDKLIFEKLNNIEIQTTKTNGRVTKLEETQSNCPNINKLETRVSGLEKWKWKSVGYIGGVVFVVSIIYKVFIK